MNIINLKKALKKLNNTNGSNMPEKLFEWIPEINVRIYN